MKNIASNISVIFRLIFMGFSLRSWGGESGGGKLPRRAAVEWFD